MLKLITGILVLVIPLSSCASTESDLPQPASPVSPNYILDTDEMREDCDPNYQGPCIPIVSYDLDCPDINGPVYVVGYDVHGFDRDRDGVGCEPWP